MSKCVEYSGVNLCSQLFDCEGKAIQLQVWTGPEVSRSRGFKISRHSVHEGD